MPPANEFLKPETMPPAAGYSHVVIVPPGAAAIHISGQVPLDAAGNLVGGNDFAAQAEQAFANVAAALEAAGASFRDVVKINMFVTDMANLAALREVRDRFIDRENPPASTLLQVSGFFRPDILFEIDATAAVAR